MGYSPQVAGSDTTERLHFQSCLTLCDSVDCSPPGSSVRRIFQARILEWVAISFSRGSSPPSYITGGFFTNGAAWEAQLLYWEVPIQNIHFIQNVFEGPLCAKYCLRG